MDQKFKREYILIRTSSNLTNIQFESVSIIRLWKPIIKENSKNKNKFKKIIYKNYKIMPSFKI